MMAYSTCPGGLGFLDLRHCYRVGIPDTIPIANSYDHRNVPIAAAGYCCVLNYFEVFAIAKRVSGSTVILNTVYVLV